MKQEKGKALNPYGGDWISPSGKTKQKNPPKQKLPAQQVQAVAHLLQYQFGYIFSGWLPGGVVGRQFWTV